MSKALLKGGDAWRLTAQVNTTHLSQEACMRVQLIGKFSLEELQKAIAKINGDLSKNGITRLSSVNLYFQTFSDEGHVYLYDDDKNEIEHMVTCPF